jgi:type II secretory pathway component GspD/PulD (secretin)
MNTETNETTGVTTTTGTAQSLSYGLIFGVNGWLSGDGMITMTVSATVSRSAESSSTSSKADNVLPNTTERVINTQLRVEAGKPVVISGLLQKEKIKTVSQVPILGSIPLLGTLFRTTTEKDNVTELTIYILPHIIPLADAEDRDADAIARYYQSFVRGSHGTP